MAKIVKYQLVGGRHIPSYVEDGGYFYDEGTGWMYGVSVEGALPQGVIAVNRDDFISAVKSMVIIEVDEGGVNESTLSVEQKKQRAITWLVKKGL